MAGVILNTVIYGGCNLNHSICIWKGICKNLQFRSKSYLWHLLPPPIASTHVRMVSWEDIRSHLDCFSWVAASLLTENIYNSPAVQVWAEHFSCSVCIFISMCHIFTVTSIKLLYRQRDVQWSTRVSLKALSACTCHSLLYLLYPLKIWWFQVFVI